MNTNTLFLCEANSRALYFDSIVLNQPFWIGDTMPRQLQEKGQLACEFRTRHQQPLRPGLIKFDIIDNQPNFVLHCSDPERAPTPGQVIVFYEGDICLGGAIISERNFRHFPSERRLELHGSDENQFSATVTQV